MIIWRPLFPIFSIYLWFEEVLDFWKSLNKTIDPENWIKKKQGTTLSWRNLSTYQTILISFSFQTLHMISVNCLNLKFDEKFCVD